LGFVARNKRSTPATNRGQTGFRPDLWASENTFLKVGRTPEGGKLIAYLGGLANLTQAIRVYNHAIEQLAKWVRYTKG
jgi:hypothetical protein